MWLKGEAGSTRASREVGKNPRGVGGSARGWGRGSPERGLTSTQRPREAGQDEAERRRKRVGEVVAAGAEDEGQACHESRYLETVAHGSHALEVRLRNDKQMARPERKDVCNPRTAGRQARAAGGQRFRDDCIRRSTFHQTIPRKASTSPSSYTCAAPVARRSAPGARQWGVEARRAKGTTNHVSRLLARDDLTESAVVHPALEKA